MLEQDRRQTVSEVAETVNLGKTTVFKMMKKDLDLSKLAPKMVPCVLTQEQKDFRVRLCRLNIASLQDDSSFLNRIVSGDESPVSLKEVETKQDSCQWIKKGKNAIRPHKARRCRSTRKSMLTVFLDSQGVIQAEFTPRGETIDAEAYCHTLRRLRENIRKKRPHLWAGHQFLLHHDNASPHTAVFTLAFIGERDMEMVPHPPYSPDLAPCDFFMFPRLKAELRGRQFRRIPEMQEAVKIILRRIPAEEFQNCMNSLPICWMKCIKAGGDYFEGSHLAVDPEGNFGLFFGDPESDLEEESDNDSD